MSKENHTQGAPEFQGEDDLASLHEYLRISAELAREAVAAWNVEVAEWGDRPLPVKAFEDHPAAKMVRQWLRPDEFGAEFADEWSPLILSLPNSAARTESEGCKRFAAARLDTIDKAADQMAAFCAAEMCNLVAAALDTLLLLRTTTPEDLAGLPVDNIPGCILVRTVDVREGGGDA